MHRSAIVWLTMALALAGCTNDPALDAGGGADAATRDVGTSDAGDGSDGGAHDGGSLPPADFVEPAVDANDGYLGGTPDLTGLTLGATGALEIAGTAAATDPNEVWIDSDMFRFAIGADTRVRAELAWTADASHWSIAILRPDHAFAVWWGIGTERRALTESVDLPAGEYLLHVARGPESAAAPASYRARIVAAAPDPCAASSAAPAYAEADEASAAHRANDVASILWPGFPRVSATAAADAAEATAITLATDAVIAGRLANVRPDGDEYFDRDAFAITTGPATTELHVHAELATADADADVFVLAEGDPARVLGAGARTGLGGDDAVVPVAPDTTYWIWIGSRALVQPADVDYRLTVCAR